MTRRGFNLIGFDRYNYDRPNFRRCSIHAYKRLLPSKTDPSILFCPECGSEFPINVNDTITEQGIRSDLPKQGTTQIVQAKRKKRLFSEAGEPIPADDKDAIRDMQDGKRIVSYHEQKVEENKDKVVSIGKYGKVRWSDLM